MSDEVLIFGKDSCPYTQAAIEDYQARKVPVRYVNVKKDAKQLDRMIRLSGGREVPVILENGKVTVGFGGT